MGKRLRYWVKLDSNRRPIAGVLEVRAARPTQGEWMEIAGTPCCAASVAIPAGDLSAKFLRISCGGEIVGKYALSASATASVSDITAAYPGIGTFTQDGEYFYLQSTLCTDLKIEVVS